MYSSRTPCTLLLGRRPLGTPQATAYQTAVHSQPSRARCLRFEILSHPVCLGAKSGLPVSAGAVAGASGTVITYPGETMRAHMAVGGCSYRKVAAEIIRAHGHRGFWNGYRAGVVSLLVYYYAQVLEDLRRVLGMFALLDIEPDEYQGIQRVIGVAMIVTTAPCDIIKPWWHDISTHVVGATLAQGKNLLCSELRVRL
jgi:hypothetical protein